MYVSGNYQKEMAHMEEDVIKTRFDTYLSAYFDFWNPNCLLSYLVGRENNEAG